MGCVLCDCSNEHQNMNTHSDKFDASILNSIILSSTDTSPLNTIDISFNIENKFIFDVNMGEGTFGFSMKIIEKPTKKEYSLKILPKDMLIEQQLVKDIKGYYEKKRKILINSSYINSILSIYENEDNYFMIRDLAPLTLRTKINNSKLPFKLSEVKNIMFQLFKNIKYLHDNNIIHGNIKPENILFFNKNEIKLEDDSHFVNFQRNNKISNYLFLSPEILSNNYNEKCDEWSCGVIMYYLLCGKFPYSFSSIDELNSNIFIKNNFTQNEEFKQLNSNSKDLISKLLNLNYNLRYSSEDALSHKFFDQDSNDLDDLNDNSENNIYNRNINSVMKIYFIFIVVFKNDANINELFTNYILGDGFEVENEKWKLLKFLSDNLICYEDENIKHIINYLFNNHIYLFNDNLKIVFDFFCKNNGENEPTIKIKDIVNSLKILLENIYNNNPKFTDDLLDKNLSYDEFKYIISSFI